MINFRATLLASTLLAAAPLGAQTTVPQEAAAPVENAGEIVVTGSRIARPDLERSVPTLVVGQEALLNRGFNNIADLATTLPQFAASFGSSRTQSTFSGAATSGLNLINLRNLGGGRTLTLLNGRRLPGGTSTGTAVDFNMIPSANVDRIEVITGGASAVYGADAVAGVVNVITRRIDGFEAGASYSITQEGDNENPSGYVMFGADLGDRGHFAFTGQVDYQGFVGCASRFLCAEDFAWTSPTSQVRGPAGYSAVGVNGTFFLTAANGLPAISATRIGSSASFTDGNGSLIPFVTSRDGYNRNARRTLAIPTTRFLAAAQGDYELVDGISAFFEFNYGRSETNAAFEGHPFQSAQSGSLFGGGPGVAGLQASIPIDNPFIPTAVRDAAVARGQTSISWQQRFEPFDDRGAVNERQTFRAVGGFRGNVTDNIKFEVNYVHGQTKLDSLTRGLVSTRQLYYGLRVEPDGAGGFRCSDPGARATGCVPINPFAPYTDAMKRALNVAAGQRGRSVLNDAQAFLSGDIFNLPAGPVGFAVGVEYRTFSGNLDYDTPINNAEVTGNQIGDIDYVKTKTKEAFVEAVVPILKDQSFTKSLTLEGAFRRSSPNRGSDYDTWKYGGTWEPVEGVKFRAVRARAVRTPTPGELSGIGQNFGVVNDPCTASRRTANATRTANCAADGVPATYTPPLVVEQGVGGFVGGNPNLAPERATTLTYGIALTPRFLPGFSFTADRFEIKLGNVINTVGRQLKANQCYDTVARLFCSDVIRADNPNVPGANYVLKFVNDQLINVATVTIKGIDFEGRYSFPALDGRVSLQALATVYDKAELVPLPGQAPTNLLGFAGGSTSDQGYIRVTGNGNVGFSNENIGLNYNLRYIGKTKMSPFLAAGFPEVSPYIYHNLRVSFKIERKYEFYLGMNNVLNTKPPFFATGASGTQALDTIPAYYDIFGRTLFAGFKLRL